MANRPTYSELLKHPFWQRKRLEILERSGFCCESCGAQDKTLHVHHTYYEKGLKPWEYPDHSLRCLCENCHAEAGELAARLQRQIGRLGTADLEQLLGYATGMIAREEPDAAIELHSAEAVEGIAQAWGLRAKDIIDRALNRGEVTGQVLEEIRRTCRTAS